ncbi:MAG: serine/threonine-protein phosphatase [Desulfobacterales bacterium]|nr:serine/threonine-protein phosphatase [Desulfobacterales bacterium]
MIVIESAGISDVGKKRKGNEDALFLDDDLKLYIVADGMGGHLAGEVASAMVVKTIRDHMRRLDAEGEKPARRDPGLSKEANRLVSGIHRSNQKVFEASLEDPGRHGMGSTISTLYFTDETLIAANVGDSPIYLIHDGAIELLSVPHTVMAEHAALDPEGRITPPEMMYQHMLTRAMGIQETVEVDVSEIRCRENDIVVIGSDGLSDKVSPGEILEIANDEDPGKACTSLVALANERGGEDNITVIVARVAAAPAPMVEGGPIGRMFQKTIRLIKGFFKRFK